MPEAPALAPTRGRGSVDPFVLPAATDAHFTLLIVSVVGASILLYTLLFNSIGPLRDAARGAEQACEALAAQAVRGDSVAAVVQRSQIAHACEQPTKLLTLGWELGSVAILLLVTLGLYWWLPIRMLRQAGFRPLRAADAPDLVAAVQALSQQAGLREPPHLVWNPLNRSNGGVAFGRWGRRYLGLYGGTYLRFRRSPDLFRAVVLHELAHIRNADVDKAGLAVTVWWAFLGVGLVPAVLGLLFGGRLTPVTPIMFGWRVLALAGLVVLTRAAVLRTRELYADQRVAAWNAQDPDAIVRAVGLLEAGPTATRAWRLPAWLSQPLSLHPNVGDRVATLRERSALFRADVWTAFGAGIAATLALEGTDWLVFNALPDSGELSSDLAAIVFAPLAVVGITLPIWRSQLYAQASAADPQGQSITRFGLAFGAGLFVGWHLSFAAYAIDMSDVVIVGSQRLTFEVALAAFVLGCMGLFVGWLQVCARTWTTELSATAHRLRWALLASTVSGGLVLVLWLAHTEYAIISGLVSPPSLSTAGVQADMAAHGMLVSASRELAVLVDVFDPLTLTMSAFTSIALAVLWAVPLAAVRVRRLRHPAEPGLQLRFILIGGLVAGVLSAALIAAEVWLTNEHALPMELSWLLFAVGPAALGLMVLRRAGWLGPLQGLCAAQVAGLVALAILVELASAAHLTVPQQSWLSMFNGGTIVAGLLIVGVAQLSTRLATLAHSQAGLASPVQR